MTFGERLTELRKENGYNTRNEFADVLGIPSTTLRNYETDVREPGHTFLKQISEFFNVSVDYLLCLTNEKEVLNSIKLRKTEECLIKKYRDLDDHGRELVDLVLDKEYQRIRFQIEFAKPSPKRTAKRLIQYYQRLASAGTGQFVFDGIPVDSVEVPDLEKYRKAKFAIGVNGDSMEPLYYDGDTLYVEPTPTIEFGEIGIFMIGDSSVVKKCGKDCLISLNPKYAPIPFTEEIRCVGRVIGKRNDPDDLLSAEDIQALHNGQGFDVLAEKSSDHTA